MEKLTTTLNIDDMKYTIDYFVDNNMCNKWIPATRAESITGLDLKTLKKNIGSHMFKRIEFEDNKILCVDAIGLMKIAFIIDSPSLLNEISKFSIVQNDVWFKIDKASRGIKSIISLLSSRKILDHKINLYDRIGGDIQHYIENEEYYKLNGDLEKELKLSRNLRRSAKIEKDAGDLLSTEFSIEKLSSLVKQLDENIRCNKERLYRPRIDAAETEFWNGKVAKYIK